MLVLSLAVAVWDPIAETSAQPGTQAAGATNVDLAAVPAVPSMLPEPGFQVVQAGHLEEFGFQYGVSTDGFNPADWAAVTGHWRQGYSMLLARLADPANPASAAVAYYLTYVIEWDSDASAITARDTLNMISQATGVTQVGQSMVSTSAAGLSAIGVHGRALIWTTYSLAGGNVTTPVVNDRWNQASIAALNDQSASRLAAATAAAGTDPGLSQAALRITGPDAMLSIAWAYYPTADYYRVLNGAIAPGPGEASVPDPQTTWPGIDDLYFSRQTLGADRYDYLIEMGLARFTTPESAQRYAANPAQSDIPSRLIGQITVMDQVGLGDGVIRQQIQVAGEVPVQGFRTVRVQGNVVQTITLLGSGSGVVSEDAISRVTVAQSACLDAAPAACLPMSEDQLGVPLRADMT